MSIEKMHIDSYIKLLLSDRKFRSGEYRKFVDNCYMLPDLEGDIAPAVLSAVIRHAKWNRRIRNMLSDILWYVSSNSISNENFQLILRFSRKRRNTYLAVIGHKELAFCQMQTINRFSVSFEAFAWLFDQICGNDLFKEEDMMQILRDASDVTSFGIQSCIDSSREKYGDSLKIITAERWVKRKEANQK